jgi:hypothetical protein
MVQAVGSSVVAGSYGGNASTGVLQSQLDRYQVQLDDWCHCPGGKTPEGKAKIQDLTSKVDTIKAQLQQVSPQQRPSPSQSSPAPSAATANSGQASGTATVSRSPSAFSPLGSRLDVFA